MHAFWLCGSNVGLCSSQWDAWGNNSALRRWSDKICMTDASFWRCKLRTFDYHCMCFDPQTVIEH